MRFFRSLFRAGKLNADPVQQQLAQLMIEGAEGPMGSANIRGFVLDQNWTPSEEEDRIYHAVTMAGMKRPDLYHTLKRMGKEHIAWSSAD
jgi:hypothetical protein